MLRKIFLPAVMIALAAIPCSADAIRMSVELDATDLPRKLLHTTMRVPVNDDTLSMWYPEWIPGIHGPRGPIRNMAGLRVETVDGKAVPWKRDDTERFLFHIDPPRGTKEVMIFMDYICSQPTVNSRGVDSYGNSLLGVINWNTCVLYPDGYDSEDILVDVQVRFPEGWKHASSLRPKDSVGAVEFEQVSMHELIDTPMICGPYMRTVDISAGGMEVYLHLASEAEAALRIGEELEGKYRAMVAEAAVLFEGAPFDRYDLLVYMSDDFPYTGLEHLKSSLNGVGERDLLDEKEIQGWVGYLVPHEFAHAWCGKYRRPAGMATPDFHTDKQTNLLWVYEGLDQYLGEVLCVRSGIWNMDTYQQAFALKLSRLMHQKGRQWRTLEDTAVDSFHLRGGSKSWGNWRRGQDYYNEGLLLWMEADAIIRHETDGANSLDDFCRDFMGVGLPKVDVHPFSRQDVIDGLNAVTPYDWEGFISAWVDTPQDALPLTLVERLGYRLEYATEASQYLKDSEADRSYVSAVESLGMTVSKDGTISGSLVPGFPADAAGLAPGMEIVGVNDFKFTPDRFRDAIADSVTRRSIDLLLLDGDRFQNVSIDYAGGKKYLTLMRNEDAPDLIEAIFAPRADTD